MVFDTEGFNHFLRTGQLGPLTVGMRPSEVVALLGEPESITIREEQQLVISIYSEHTLQLTYLDDVLFHIHIYFHYRQRVRGYDAGDLPPQLGVSWYPAVHHLTYAQFVTYARQHDLAWRQTFPAPTDSYEDEGYMVAVESNGVTLVFEDEITLWSISRKS